MQVDLLVHNIGELVTVARRSANDGPRRGASMRELGIIRSGAVAIHQGRIVAVGPEGEVRAGVDATEELDAGRRSVIPGFVDPHTHLPWAGHRAAEFEMRIAGATYMEIMAAGGGIVRTVSDTRAAATQVLVRETQARMDRMLAHGTTTAEAKTGYGLNVTDELKQLDTIAETHGKHPLDLVPTFLPAHAVPPEYRGRTDSYVDLIVREILPAGWAYWQKLRAQFEPDWPIFCDVFCEEGAFNLAQSRRILLEAQRLGFGLKMHVDEFAPLGGTPLAVELGAISVDHIVTTPSEHVIALAQSDTIGVALPGTPFGLGHHEYTPARALIDGGGAVALATDLNPGTTWCESMQFMIALACRYMKLTPAEAVVAATLNAAYAIGLGHRVGSLEPAKLGDMLILDTDDYRMLGYRYGTNMVRTVIKSGKLMR
jgi:imidazolonepropionase